MPAKNKWNIKTEPIEISDESELCAHPIGTVNEAPSNTNLPINTMPFETLLQGSHLGNFSSSVIETRLGGIEVDIGGIAQSLRDLNASMQWIMDAQQQQHDQFLQLQQLQGGGQEHGDTTALFAPSTMDSPQSAIQQQQQKQQPSYNQSSAADGEALSHHHPTTPQAPHPSSNNGLKDNSFPYDDPEDPGFWFDVLSWPKADPTWITRMSVKVKQFVMHSIGRSAARSPLILSWDALMLVARCAPQNMSAVVEEHLHRFWIEVAKSPRGYLVTTELRWMRFPQQLRRQMEREFEDSGQSNNADRGGRGGRYDSRDDEGNGGGKRVRVEYELRGRPVQRRY